MHSALSPMKAIPGHIWRASEQSAIRCGELHEELWEGDRAHRAEPARLTKLIHSAVPILAHLKWRVMETARGSAR